MTHFENNCNVLKQRFPGLLEDLISENTDNIAPEEIIIESAQSGDPVLSVRGIYVHSPRDPVREGNRLAHASNTGSGPIVVLGFGFGYAALAAAEFGRPIVIVEKYKNLLVKAFELRDFTDFLSKQGLIFVPGNFATEGIINALAAASGLAIPDDTPDKPQITIVRNKALNGLDEEWYKTVEDRIRTWSMKDKVNTATQKRFGQRWVRNLARNMSAIRDYPGISLLSDVAAPKKIDSRDSLPVGIPVLLAAAGPSLDKILPFLHDIHRRCMIIAVDTNLRFFSKNGVYPDFALSVDPQFWNSRHLDRCNYEKTILVAESAVYPSVLNLPFKKIFLCSSLFPLGMFIEKQVDLKGRLRAGGSVATTAWDFARKLGASSIWIAGLDLAYPELKTHFSGARFEERSGSETFRLNTGETWVVRALRDGIPFKAPCTGGGQVLTDRKLSLYAAWFENQFDKYVNVKSYGLFQEGLSITGLNAKEIKNLLELPDRRGEINDRIEETLNKTCASFFNFKEMQDRSDRYKNAVSGLVSGLESIEKAAAEGREITKRALNRSLNIAQREKIAEDLDKITKRISESEVKEVAGFLFDKTEKENDSDLFRAYLKTTHKLFSSLVRAANFNLEYLSKALQ